MYFFTRESGFDFSHPDYRRLYEVSEATVFQSPEWLEQICRVIAPRRKAEIFAITGRNRTGELVFALPLARFQRYGCTVVEAADFGITDYCAPIVRNGLEGVLAGIPEITGEIQALLGRHDLFRVKSIREEHVDFWRMLLDCNVTPAGYSAHAVQAGSDFVRQRRKLYGKSFTRYLDRRRRRLKKGFDSRLRLITDPSEAYEAIYELRELRTGRFEGDPIAEDEICAFYATMAGSGARNGTSRTYKLTANGKTVGILFGINHLQRFHYLIIGCDYENFSKYSPGLLMYDDIIADWIACGGRVFDFTIGDEPFKARFGTDATKMYRIMRPRTVTGRIASSVISARANFQKKSTREPTRQKKQSANA